LVNPWLALTGYGLYVVTQANPVNTINRFVGPRFAKRFNL